MTKKKPIDVEEHIPEFIAWLNKKVSISNKIKLNKHLLGRIEKLCSLGYAEFQMYKTLGIPKSTWFCWKRQGKTVVKELETGVKKMKELTEFEVALLIFLSRLTHGKDCCLDKHYTNVELASEGSLPGQKTPDWRASAWILERIFPETFGRKRLKEYQQRQEPAKLPDPIVKIEDRPEIVIQEKFDKTN